jgi:hypothetical protein
MLSTILSGSLRYFILSRYFGSMPGSDRAVKNIKMLSNVSNVIEKATCQEFSYYMKLLIERKVGTVREVRIMKMIEGTLRRMKESKRSQG